ncbi:MAG: hypothetical protein HYS13_10930 [Planctomycetia bacterium]|nr:hypothetical protein [Planctomycetia bacterium]
MIPQEMLRDIATKLLEKSRKGEVRWQHRPNDRFLVKFPKSAIDVQFVSPTADPDYVEITVKNDEGHRVGWWVVNDEEEDWPLAFGLFQEAHRYVSKWDVALTDLEKAVEAEGPIGVAQPPPVRIPF